MFGFQELPMFPDVIQASTTSAYIPGLNLPLDSSVLALSSLNGASDTLSLIPNKLFNGRDGGNHRTGLRRIR
jgi:hypothetical protein